MNNVMMNPNLLMRYSNLMNNGSPEAKDLFQRIMNEEYQQRMMDMMTHAQQNGGGNIFTPSMGMGMNPMMDMMGMNPMMK